MINKHIALVLLALLSLCVTDASGKAQKFFNLTADEVRIDSVLPYFTHSMPLGGEWADSVYTVSIEYPEFLEMSDADVARYSKSVTGGPGLCRGGVEGRGRAPQGTLGGGVRADSGA